jgi:hypothetical protein
VFVERLWLKQKNIPLLGKGLSEKKPMNRKGIPGNIWNYGRLGRCYQQDRNRKSDE